MGVLRIPSKRLQAVQRLSTISDLGDALEAIVHLATSPQYEVEEVEVISKRIGEVLQTKWVPTRSALEGLNRWDTACENLSLHHSVRTTLENPHEMQLVRVNGKVYGVGYYEESNPQPWHQRGTYFVREIIL